MRARARLAVGLAAAVIATAGGAVVAAAGQPGSPPYEPVVITAPDLVLRGHGDAGVLVPVHRFTAGEAQVDRLVAYAEPDPAPDAAPVATLPNPTHEGHPLVVSVIDRTSDGRWLQVRLPMRPNGTTGWIEAADVRAWEVPNRIEVTLSTNRLAVYDGDSDVVLFETDVATGRPNTPTPTGEFFVDIIVELGHHRVYGWGQMSVSGFSDVLERFAGGIGQIAIHGWNNDSVMGTSASNGCVRMRNIDIARVAELAPLGTPVRIVP